MNALIGYTGFVGSNISNQIKFDFLFNSKNIHEILNNSYDLVVCSAISAEKFLANKYPEEDIRKINNLKEQIKELKCKKFVLISTIDVIDKQIDSNENTIIDKTKLEPYGYNRLDFENFVLDNFKDVSIIRLPALFGKGLKKNFIFDMINKIPSMIMNQKFNEISSQINNEEQSVLFNSYTQDSNGNYVLNKLDNNARKNLIEVLEKVGFTSSVFTDSRSEFQFYDLSNISKDIDIVIKNNIKIINFNSMPISTKDIGKQCFNTDFNNIISVKQPIKQDVKTIYASYFNSNSNYMYSKEDIVSSLNKFIGENTNV